MDPGYLLNLSVASLLMAVAAGVGCRMVVPLWDVIARRRLGWRAERLSELGFADQSVREAMRLWGITLVAVPVVVGHLLAMPPIAVLTTIGLFVLPTLVATRRIKQRETLLRDQLVGAATTLADAVKSGENLRDGLAVAALGAPEPLGISLRRVVAAHDRGQPLPEALTAVEQRLKLESFTLFSVSLRVAYERGGRLNEALRRISKSLLENQRIERKLDADTSSGRHAAILMSCFPVLFLGLFYLLDARATALLFTTLLGQAAISIAALLTYAGGRWTAHILEIDA